VPLLQVKEVLVDEEEEDENDDEDEKGDMKEEDRQFRAPWKQIGAYTQAQKGVPPAVVCAATLRLQLRDGGIIGEYLVLQVMDMMILRASWEIFAGMIAH
jgi:hypothetical protein